MTSRWNALIITVALVALTSMVPSPNVAQAGDQVDLRLAQAPGGDSPETGKDRAAPGGEDNAPGAAPGGGEEKGPAAAGQGGDSPKREGASGAAKAEPAGADADAAAAAKDAAKDSEPSAAKKPVAEEKQAAPADPKEKQETPAAAAKPEAEPESAEAPEKDETPAEPGASDKDQADAGTDSQISKSGIAVPSDPVAKAAFFALEKNCARCHQVGPLLKKSKPEKGFGNILQLTDLAEDSAYITPGVPEGSKLFSMIAKEQMPYDCYQAFSCKVEPTHEDLDAIYNWIVMVGNPQCGDRYPLDEAAIVTAIAADLDKQQEDRRRGMRYITLANLYNSCAKDEDLKIYRQAVVKLLNSLSTNPDALALRTIDPAGTIIGFNLDDLNWSEEDWNRIISVYPYAMHPDITAYETVKALTDTPLAWVRGDWFAFTASRPPLYYDLLKLPQTFAELEQFEKVDIKRNIEKFVAKRAGFRHSGVSAHNRLIERHTIPTGYFWTSYDFKGDGPEQSLFLHPLGPDGPNAFRQDGGESIFSLPNGFQAYYLNTAAGERLASGPIEIVRDDSQRDRLVTNGISCFGCHKLGINRTPDEIRNHVAGDLSFGEEVQKKVAALYPPEEEMNLLLNQDAQRYRDALLKAGLDPDLDADSPYESINALSRRYERDVLQYMAAAEFGLDREVFKSRLNNVGEPFIAIKQRLAVGQLPRRLFEDSFKQMLTRVSSENRPIDLGTAGALAGISKVPDSTELTLVADRAEYSVNDLPTFTVTPTKDCHLTVVNVEPGGQGVVIFPNDFEKDNFVPKGKSVRIPAENAEWQFRLQDPGTETVIAVCNASGKDVDGIKHDFKTREFTSVGNRRESLTRQIIFEGKKKIAEGQKAKQAGDKEKAESIAKGDDLSRTAIQIKVNKPGP